MPDAAAPEPEVAIPEPFLADLLSRTADVAILKAVLYVARAATARGEPAVPYDDLLVPDVLRAITGLQSPEPAEERLRRVVGGALADGLLLRLRVEGDERLLPATARNQRLVEELSAGEAAAARTLHVEEDDQIGVYRPNVYAFYERNIGPLTPLVAEQLRDAERAYPRGWIEEAIRTAVAYNRRNWRYVESILARWEESGAPAGISADLP